MNHNFTRLESNIFDMLQEQQLKLGYMKETVRLYYPASSLLRLMGVEDISTIYEYQRDFSSRIGQLDVSGGPERFCLTLGPEVSEYVHNHMPANGFLEQFIDTVSRHGVSIDDILGVFRSFSDKVHVEKLESADFDYVVYFEDGQPDAYRYCLNNEGHHIIYHRFLAEDYMEMLE